MQELLGEMERCLAPMSGLLRADVPSQFPRSAIARRVRGVKRASRATGRSPSAGPPLEA